MKNDEFDVVEDRYKKNKEKSSKVIGILFTIWFFISIILMMYFSEINENYAIMTFGQFFLIFGLFTLIMAKASSKLFGLPFSIIGTLMIVIPYLKMNPDLLEIKIYWDNVELLLVTLSFVIVGVVLLILPSMVNNYFKKRCTETVIATINKETHGPEIYEIIYTFEYNGKQYNVSKDFYSTINTTSPVESEIEIKINPDNPEQFLDKKINYPGSIIVGIVFLALSLPVLITVLNEYKFIQ